MKTELEQLESIERPKITQQIAEARDKGDLSENAEYDAAKEAQGLLEMKISKIKDVIANSKVIDGSQLDTSKVSILCTVRLKNNATKQEQKFTLVPDNESDIKTDAMPLVKGHTLVVPKKEVDLIFDLESEEFKNLWGFAQKVAQKVGDAIPCIRVGIAVVGIEVPHAHIHLVPLNSMQDLNFGNERLKLTPEEYKEVQDKIVNQ
ncbi:hypothetical protein Lal_00014605 [Lupinus albus]|nr:hypothetical protein Lal_00014605 [Lupinus albus]